jgi:hypothetical protein
MSSSLTSPSYSSSSSNDEFGPVTKYPGSSIKKSGALGRMVKYSGLYTHTPYTFHTLKEIFDYVVGLEYKAEVEIAQGGTINADIALKGLNVIANGNPRHTTDALNLSLETHSTKMVESEAKLKTTEKRIDQAKEAAKLAKKKVSKKKAPAPAPVDNEEEDEKEEEEEKAPAHTSDGEDAHAHSKKHRTSKSSHRRRQHDSDDD